MTAPTNSTGLTSHSAAPRIAPVPASERVGEVRDLLNRLLPPGVQFSQDTPDRNLPCTVVKHPGVYEPWAMLGSRLRGGLLPLHDRELVTLRVATLVASPYEWAHHSRSAAASGVTAEEMAAVQRGTEGPWDAATAAKLQAVDDIYSTHRISEETWTLLSHEYDEQQMIELIMLIGFYSMTGWLLNSAQIEVDGWLSGDRG